MRDYAREDAGAGVVMASCVDERFPPENMLDGKDGTFWITTGMFPQEFVLALGKTIHVSRITTLSLGVKKLAVERGEHDKPDQFEKVFEAELTNRGDRLQSEVHQVNIKARYLKFTILSGYAEHATMNRVSVLGESPGGEDAGTNEDDGTNYKSGNYQGAAKHANAHQGAQGEHSGSYDGSGSDVGSRQHSGTAPVSGYRQGGGQYHDEDDDDRE